LSDGALPPFASGDHDADLGAPPGDATNPIATERFRKILKVRGLMVIKAVSLRLMNLEMEQRIKRHFGERVRQLRKAKELSQETLALVCDLDRTYIGGVERGERNISLINIHKIADALSVSAKELFDA